MREETREEMKKYLKHLHEQLPGPFRGWKHFKCEVRKALLYEKEYFLCDMRQGIWKVSSKIEKKGWDLDAYIEKSRKKRLI